MAMTLSEFAKHTGTKIRDAYNAKDAAQVDKEFRSASAKVHDAGYTGQDVNKFWTEVRAEFRSGQLLFEKQAGSSLHQLMKDIESRLASLSND